MEEQEKGGVGEEPALGSADSLPPWLLSSTEETLLSPVQLLIATRQLWLSRVSVKWGGP